MANRKIHSLVSDLDIERELILNLKQRSLNQKFIYMNEGAKRYYDSVRMKRANKWNRTVDEESEIGYGFISGSLQKGIKIAIVSLGCGDSSPEKGILQKLHGEGYDISYFGIDASKSMLEFAAENLKDLPIRAEFICADITADHFRDEVERLTDGFEMRVFAFLGRTFNNPNQTQITDSLYNMLSVNDVLWLDAPIRPGVRASDDMRIFERYASYLQNAEIMESDFYPLLCVGVPYGSGKMQLASDREESVGALVFRFSFLFTAKTVISIRNEKIHFLPNEKIELLTIRTYDQQRLIGFFQEHEFSLEKQRLDSVGGDVSIAQFLFKKSA